MPDWLEVGLRTEFAIITLFVLTRLLGKRQVSQLSLFEYINGISLGGLAVYISLHREAKWYLGFVSLSVWILMSLGIEYLQLKSKTARNWIDSKETIVIKNGKILENNLKKERITSDELLEQLRKKNIFKTSDVEFAIIEPNGEINALVKNEHQPLTAAHLGIKVKPEQEPQTVIMDGVIMDEPLARTGMNREWLHTELEKLGVTIENVFLGQVDSYGEFHADLFDDRITVPEPQQRASLLAQLKKCEADLEMFGLSTNNEPIKQMYLQCSKKLEKMISDIKPLLIQ